MYNFSKCLEYARRAKRENNLSLYRFYLQKARAYVEFYQRR